MLMHRPLEPQVQGPGEQTQLKVNYSFSTVSSARLPAQLVKSKKYSEVYMM